jgi:hypothetical protein
MGLNKTVMLTEETHKRLKVLKAEEGCNSLDQTIALLLENNQ